MDRERRKVLRRAYGYLFERVAAVLLAADPIGIFSGGNTDEYDPEATAVLPKLRECGSVFDVQRLLHREFLTYFGPQLAGPESIYLGPARDIWALWKRFQNCPESIEATR